MIVLFDLETIPDVELIKTLEPQLFNQENEIVQLLKSKDKNVEKIEDKDVGNIYKKHLEEKGKSTFLKPCFHKIIAVGLAILDDDLSLKTVNVAYEGKEKDNLKLTEEVILRNFLQYIDNKNPIIGGYNTKSFDLPVILQRSMKYKIWRSCPEAWNNTYLNKWKSDHHIDLMQALSFNGYPNLSFAEACALCGFKGKDGVDGSMVEPMYYDGKIAEIAKYVQRDTLGNVLLLYSYLNSIGRIENNQLDSLNQPILERLENL